MVRKVCLEVAVQAYEEAGISGLCAEGRWEAAISAMESLEVGESLSLLPAPAEGELVRTGSRDGPEAWLGGPVQGVPTTLGPAAHALLDALAEAEHAVADLPSRAFQLRPSGIASLEFHLRHAAGAIDRLLTYAKGEALSVPQREALAAEGEPRSPAPTAEDLVEELRGAVDEALAVYRASSEGLLDEPRRVGRAGLPSTVRGLLYHAAEHTRRHSGQIVTTAAVVRGLVASSGD